MCYHTHFMSKITLSYVTNACPVLGKNTIQIFAPAVYLLYSNNENISVAREKINSILFEHRPVRSVKTGEISEAGLVSASL